MRKYIHNIEQLKNKLQIDNYYTHKISRILRNKMGGVKLQNKKNKQENQNLVEKLD